MQNRANVKSVVPPVFGIYPRSWVQKHPVPVTEDRRRSLLSVQPEAQGRLGRRVTGAYTCRTLSWLSLTAYCFPSSLVSYEGSILYERRNVKRKGRRGYLKSDVGFFCFRVFEKGGCSKVLCGVFSFRAVRGKAVAVKFYVGFPIRSDLCRKRHRHLTEDADAFLLECSGNQLNNSSSFCWSVPSLAYGSASNCRKLCLMSFVSSLKPRMYESAM